MSEKRRNAVLRLAYAGMFLALCLLLPFLTGNNRELGNILCLMHIPVFLCGLICGPIYGATIGLCAPVVRSFLFGMPPFPVVAVPMALELAVYGLLTGLLYRVFPKKTLWLYPNLVISMIVGRIFSIATKYALYALGKTEFSFLVVCKLNFITTLPGAMLQFLLIPAVMYALKAQGVLSHDR